jgi:hypothetical protein
MTQRYKVVLCGGKVRIIHNTYPLLRGTYQDVLTYIFIVVILKEIFPFIFLNI